jgi:hypothetical protein
MRLLDGSNAGGCALKASDDRWPFLIGSDGRPLENQVARKVQAK